MCRVTIGHLRVTVGNLRVTIGHLRVIMGHLRLTIGYLKATVVHIRVKLGDLKVTIGFLSISKHKANTTELHPKVRQTCCFHIMNSEFWYIYFLVCLRSVCRRVESGISPLFPHLPS